MADDDKAAVGTGSDPLYRSSERSSVKIPHTLADGYAKIKVTRVSATVTATAQPTTALTNRCFLQIQNMGSVAIEVVTETSDGWGDGWRIAPGGEWALPLSAGAVVKLVTETDTNNDVVLAEYAPY